MQKSAPTERANRRQKKGAGGSATLQCTPRGATCNRCATCDLHIDAAFCRARLCELPRGKLQLLSRGPWPLWQDVCALDSQRFCAARPFYVRAAASQARRMAVDVAKNEERGCTDGPVASFEVLGSRPEIAGAKSTIKLPTRAGVDEGAPENAENRLAELCCTTQSRHPSHRRPHLAVYRRDWPTSSRPFSQTEPFVGENRFVDRSLILPLTQVSMVGLALHAPAHPPLAMPSALQIGRAHV